MRRGPCSRLLVTGCALLPLATACREARRGEDAVAQRPPPRVAAWRAPAGDERANAEREDGQWLRPAKDNAGTRFSALTQIDTANAGRLGVISTFSTGVLRGHEAAPLVVGSTMYVVTPYPNILYALDLTRPGFPVKWKYEPHPERAAQGVACCDVVNRGAPYSDGRVYYNTLDDHTVAVDAATGREIWNVRLGDIDIGETMTMAPLVAGNLVIVGNSGGELGVRGWIQALDAATGRTVWKAYSTGPDADVLIGARFRPFYAADRAPDLGVKTWPGQAWKLGGGNVWGWITYDPALGLIYYGTANPGPWNPELRPGDNKWTSSIIARDARTGEAVWAYQLTPHDVHDYDGVNESILLDLPIAGRTRKVLVHPDRNGYIYVIDRVSGEVISATPFVRVNSTSGVNLRTGRPVVNPAKTPATGRVTRDICPSASGGKDWQPSAFSPQTGLLYIPHNRLCMDAQALQVGYIAGTPYIGMDLKMFADSGGYGGAFTAWDPVAARPVWSIPERFPVWSGALVTAGGVVFYGTMDGWFKAVSARTGRLLWRFQTGSGIIGQPITFLGPDGKQYVAVLSGVGGWAGAIVAGNLDARDSSAAAGMVNATKELPKYTTKGGALYVFGLH